MQHQRTISLREAIIRCLIPLFVYMPFDLMAQEQQEISVKSFEFIENDQTALAEPILDQNNKKCALIIIKNVDAGKFRFTFGNIYNNVKERFDENGRRQYWMYVSEGAKKVTISNNDLRLKSLEYVFPKRIKSAKTYYMELQNVVSVNNNMKQYFEFIIEPENVDISLEVDGIPWSKKDGRYQELLSMGEHDFRIKANMYHGEAGTIVVNDPETAQNKKIRLKPNFGSAEIKGGAELEGAEIYIDGYRRGEGKIKADRLASGRHELKITKKLYKPFETSFEVLDDQTTILEPILSANFAETTLQVPYNAEILIDGKRVGSGEWKGPLELGNYNIVCQKTGYRSSQYVLHVTSTTEARSINLPAPEPKYGSLNVQSNPQGARITIDGEDRGTTPKRINQLIEGTHTIILSADEYQPKKQTVNIEEGGEANLNITLSNIFTINISTKPAAADIYFNGRYVGVSPQKIENVTVGDYQVKLYKKGYLSYNKQVHFSVGQSALDVRLKRKYILPNQFYMDFGWMFGAHNAASGAMGFFLSNFNLEGDFLYSFAESSPIYWSDGFSRPQSSRYSLACLTGGKTGYGFTCGTRVRITPQIGAYFIKLNEINNNGSYCDGAYAVSGSVGIRCFFALSRNLAINLTPEYLFNISQSDGFKVISSVSDDVNQWSQGIVLKSSFSVYF